MCLISFDLLFSKSISSYRKDFNNAIVRSHDLQGVESLSKLSILLNKFRKDNPKLEDDTYNNTAISLYLDIWEIKIKFLSGEIKESLDLFDELKDNDLLCNNLPYHKIIKSCIKNKNCSCENSEDQTFISMLDPKIDNLDFLRDIYLNRYFFDLALEIDNGNSTSLAVKEKAHILNGQNKIQYIISRPKNNITLNPYSKGKATKNDIIMYYIKAAQKRILEKIDTNFRYNRFRDLNFYDEYINDNEQLTYRCLIKFLPKVRGKKNDLNSSYYKLYIMDGNSAENRYTLSIDELIENKNNLKTLLINWNPYWAMQKAWDKDHVFFLFPLRSSNNYKIDGKIISNQSAFDQSDMQNIITKIDKSSFANLPDGFEDRFNITDDESIEVYKVSIKHDKNESIRLSYIDNFEESEAIKKEKQWIYRIGAICLILLLLI